MYLASIVFFKFLFPLGPMKGKISRESDIQVSVHGLVDGVLIRISRCEGNFFNLKQPNKVVDES